MLALDPRSGPKGVEETIVRFQEINIDYEIFIR